MGKLEDALAEQSRQQKMLDDEVMDCSNKLKRAEMLISGLGGEKTRWTQIAKNLRETYNSLTGKSVEIEAISNAKIEVHCMGLDIQ